MCGLSVPAPLTPSNRAWLLLLLPFLWILEAAMNEVTKQQCANKVTKQQCTNNCQVSPQIGLFGSSVELSCVCHKNEVFTLDKKIVYWQTEEEEEVVHVFRAGQDDYTGQSKRYTNRTQLLREEKKGNFSLRLSNLLLRDSKNYKCVVILDEVPMNVCHNKCAPLTVAARFSRPVVTGLTDVDFGEVVTVGCSSSNGHPAPKIYWIDIEDGSVIDPSLSENVSEIDPDTQLYSVRSKLTVNATAYRSISCLVENPVLRENLTSEHYNIVLSNTNRHEKQISKTTQATVGVLVTVLLAGVLVGGWLCKKSFCGRYRGDRVPVNELQAMEQGTSLNGSTLLQADNGTLQSGGPVNLEEPGSSGSENEAEAATPH